MTPEELAAIKSSAEDGWATSSKDTLKIIAELELKEKLRAEAVAQRNQLQEQFDAAQENQELDRKIDQSAARLRISVDEQLGRVTPQWVFNIAYGGNKHG